MPPSRGNDGNLLLTPREGALASDLSRLRITVFTASLNTICLGYNTAIIAGAKLYLEKDPDFAELVRPEETASLVEGMLVGCILAGAAIGGAVSFVMDVTGRRPAMMTVALIFIVGPVTMALAPNIWVLIAARSIVGLGVGVSSVLVNLYISEIAPAEVRGQLGGWAPFLGTSGILVSYIVSTVLGLLPNGAWRWQLGVAAVPALAQLILHRFIPETPRWLLSKDLQEEAMVSLRHLFPSAPASVLEAEVERIQADLSASQASDKLGMCDLFTRYRLATTLGISINVLQQVSGINVVIYFGPSILGTAGFNDSGAMVATCLVSLMQLVATAVLIRQVDKIGRRPLALFGILLMMAGLALLVISFFGEAAHLGGSGLDSGWTAWAAIIGMFVFRGAFSLSLGPLPYIMTSEFFPQEARAAGSALSWFSNWISNFGVSLSFPIIARAFKKSIGEDEGVAVIFCVYIVFSGVAYLLVRKMLPETRGLRLEAAAGAQQGPGARDVVNAVSMQGSGACLPSGADDNPQGGAPMPADKREQHDNPQAGNNGGKP